MNRNIGPHTSPDNAAPPAQPNNAPHPALLVTTAWLLAVAAVVAARFRGQWEPYIALHRWCAARGVPDYLRTLDSLILFAAAAFTGAGLVTWRYRRSVFTHLGLLRPRPTWGPMVLYALAPMVLGGLVLGFLRWSQQPTRPDLLSKFVAGVIRAPLAEELLFRGLLIAACAAAIGWRGPRFWLNATAAALLFAIMHVPWTAPGIVNGWPTLLMTGLGGLWYAWLLARWGSLWIPILLHAGMNLGWLLAGATGGAGGGGWTENLLRVATIALATIWTVRQTPTPPE